MIELAENEKWIPGMEGHYTADMSGEVYSYKSGSKKRMQGALSYRIIRGEKKDMYRQLCITFDGSSFTTYVHRLVAKTFLEDFKEELTINHINGDKMDNRPENLECISASENTKHAWETGLATGESRRLPPEEALRRANEFCVGSMKGHVVYYRAYVTPEYLEKFGLPVECLDFTFPLQRFSNMMQYWRTTVKMLRDMENGMTLSDMEVLYKINSSTLSRIRSKKIRQKEWEAYERIKKSLYEKLILENS